MDITYLVKISIWLMKGGWRQWKRTFHRRQNERHADRTIATQSPSQWQFRMCFAVDTTPISPIRGTGYIINRNESYLPRSHWVTINVPSHHCLPPEYYDSFGNPPKITNSTNLCMHIHISITTNQSCTIISAHFGVNIAFITFAYCSLTKCHNSTFQI